MVIWDSGHSDVTLREEASPKLHLRLGFFSKLYQEHILIETIVGKITDSAMSNLNARI